MAISASTVWEVRTTGADTNGGGWVAGASGTDWSQQDAAQYSVTDGVTAGTTTITSATANFGTDVVGNIIYVQGGTGSVVAGWYQITARTNSTTITVDRSTGLTAGTGVTLKIGGAIATINTLATIFVASNKAFVKTSGGYTSTATITFAQTCVPNNAVTQSRLIGYTTTRNDRGKAVLTLSTNTGLTGLNFTGNGWFVENIHVNCSSLGTSTGITLGTFSTICSCKVSNFTVKGLNLTPGQSVAVANEVTGGGSSATAAISLTNQVNIHWNYVHDNACPGIVTVSLPNVITHNLIVNNTGASSDGINFQGLYGTVIMGNTIHGSGRHGITQTNSYLMGGIIRNNILTSNGGYGIKGAVSVGNSANIAYDGNVYWNNTSGARNNMDDTATNAINGVNAYTNTLDVTLTGSPYTNTAGGDFSLNNTAGAGAACRAAGYPGVMPGATTTGYLDMGAAQSQSVGGGSSGAIMTQIGFNGGIL